MKRIKRFEDFETNEGIGSKLSTLALLASLGLSAPKAALADKDTTSAEVNINKKEEDVLRLINSSEELQDSLETGEKKPVDLLQKEIDSFSLQNRINLRLEDVMSTMQNPGFPININLFGYKVGEEEDSISTVSYKLNQKITFTLTKNPLWGTNLYGMKVKF